MSSLAPIRGSDDADGDVQPYADLLGDDAALVMVIATANAITQTLADASRDGATRKGCTMYTPIRIKPP